MQAIFSPYPSLSHTCKSLFFSLFSFTGFRGLCFHRYIKGLLLLFTNICIYRPKFIQIYKDKSVDADFQQHRHVVMVVKCSLWVLYGLPLVQKDSILVTTSNGVGLVIEVIYLVVFFIYCDKESERVSSIINA